MAVARENTPKDNVLIEQFYFAHDFVGQDLGFSGSREVVYMIAHSLKRQTGTNTAGLQSGTSISSQCGLPHGMLGLPHSIVAGFQEGLF